VTATSGVVQDRNASTGSLVWSVTVPSADFTTGPNTLAVQNGLVYFTSDTAANKWTLYALVESTGAISWSDTFSGSYPFTPPAVNPSALVIGLSTGDVIAVNPTSGAHLWSASTPAGVDGVAIEGPTTYAVEACRVVALSTSTGAHIFTASPPGCTATNYYGPAIAYGEVYVGSNDFHLYAINATTGAITWTATTDAGSDPSVANNLVYICFDKLQAFNATTGVNLLSITPGHVSITDVDIAGGRIYIAQDGRKDSTSATMYKLP
jgi:outer membrane protein assembly factor BamB